jgi:hypothetical protein
MLKILATILKNKEIKIFIDSDKDNQPVLAGTLYLGELLSEIERQVKKKKK